MGLQVAATQGPADVVWLRFDLSDVPQAVPDEPGVHMFGFGSAERNQALPFCYLF